MELLKLLSTSQIVAQMISFIILLIILRLFVWKRFLKVLDDRKGRIAAEFKNIEDVKAEVANIKKEYEEKLENIGETAKIRTQEAIAEGKQIVDEMREDAKAQAQKIVDNAKEAIKGEILKAKEELRADIVDLTIRASEKVIQDKLTEDADKRLVEDFLKGMDKVK